MTHTPDTARRSPIPLFVTAGVLFVVAVVAFRLRSEWILADGAATPIILIGVIGFAARTVWGGVRAARHPRE